MGGCRCSYKNCTLRTDGVTHMFHYPVFDKVRCHQWLTNAQKLEFLNLKVSQLKNRVVCQHHFKDDNFMNFLKDKLTFDAVPTEDGPYCDSTQMTDKKPEQDDTKLYSISLEDIDNEYLTFNDKKANFSVKYGDFLTNCDMMDLGSLNLTNDNTQIVSKDKSYEDIVLNDNTEPTTHTTGNPILNKTLDTFQSKSDCVYTIQVTEVPIEVEKMQANVILPFTSAESNISQSTSLENKILINKPKEPPQKRNSRSLLKERKVTILDEQKISEAVPLPDKLEPISPSTILPLPKRRRNVNIADAGNNDMQHSKIVHLDTLDTSDLTNRRNIEQVIHEPFVIETDVNKRQIESNSNAIKTLLKSNIENIKSHGSPPKTRSSVKNTVKKTNNLQLKNRIPPERTAAIQEKRKFNMKLRDIIASCLDKLDDEEERDYNRSKLKSNMEHNITQKVSSYLAKEPELPTVHEYTVSYLEARMKKMEDILLNKIDQNSQRITEIKQLFMPSSGNKTVCTQTAVSEEVTKKNLYKEISKYLKPETNSIIYEELFINKYLSKELECTPAKMRKQMTKSALKKL